MGREVSVAERGGGDEGEENGWINPLDAMGIP